MNFTATIRRLLLILLLAAPTVLAPQPASATGYQTQINEFRRWLKDNRAPQTSLPYSHVGDSRFRHWTYTYDSAVVALAYLASGQTGDAKRIIDFYRQTPSVWRLGGVIEAIESDPAGVKGQDWSVRTGSNLWLGLASYHLYQRTKEQPYLDLAKKIGEFALDRQNHDPKSPNFGGVSMGPAGDPENPDDQHFGFLRQQPAFSDSYATEINIEAYALFRFLAGEGNEDKFAETQGMVFRWLQKNSYNKTDHRFNRAYKDSAVATDVQSWGVSALGLASLDEFEKNAAPKILHFVEKNCMATVPFRKPDGKKVRVTGVDFIDRKYANALKRKQLVSPEWTFQLCNAYLRLSNDYHNRQDPAAARYAQKRERQLQQMLDLAIKTDHGLAYPYATLGGAMIGHEHKTPAAGNLSAIGPAYAILALLGFDPLYGYGGELPKR